MINVSDPSVSSQLVMIWSENIQSHSNFSAILSPFIPNKEEIQKLSIQNSSSPDVNSFKVSYDHNSLHYDNFISTVGSRLYLVTAIGADKPSRMTDLIINSLKLGLSEVLTFKPK